MKKFSIILSLLVVACTTLFAAPVTVPQEVMKRIYEEVKTPYKYGLVVASADNYHKIDCPTVFRENGKWYMSYIVYNGKEGHDGRGYETWLATSDDLLHWQSLGRLLSYPNGDVWDKNQRAGYISLIDTQWGGSYKAQSFNGKHWMSYFGGNVTGYEMGMLKECIAYTDGDITKAHEWDVLGQPVLTPTDPDHGWWESLTQYKSSVIWDKTKKLGHPFVMYYNAGGINPSNNVKAERISIALSDDMIHWQRYKGNPVVNHEEGITGDAVIQQIGDVYVMFYFSAFRKNRPYKSFNTFACSYDLVHWTDWNGADLVIPGEKYDNLFAHKSYVVKWNGVVYHFYCAVNDDNQRGIAVAVSKDMGKSIVRFPKPEKVTFRKEISLDKGWLTAENDSNRTAYAGFEKAGFNTDGWKAVNVPHNWDCYDGARRLKHGNKHGYAWYKKSFAVQNLGADKRYFLYFEGVGSYATVWLNGKQVGSHAGGRTTFTLDVTDAIRFDAPNELAVRADHPAMITDLPWVCGGCSSETGFSEGSQPMGIFRPVTLVVSNSLRVEPFGVHVWNDAPKDEKNPSMALHFETEVKNYSDRTRRFVLVNKLLNKENIQQVRVGDTIELKPGETKIVKQTSLAVKNPILWSTENPFLYKVVTMLREDNKSTDEEYTDYGLRWISWPQSRNDNDKRFYLNGKPLLINGIGEYEHQLGNSSALDSTEIEARINLIKAAGFNAFRDAHQPHNLYYKDLIDKNGLLFWSQLSAHVWYDTPEFRRNFKNNLIEWIKERRNSPSVILWGLQNESALPEDFARECTDLIRQLDPTSPSQRLVTTCNFGSGTDWNVMQNWSGTYINSGDPKNYSEVLKKELLNGEYGAWRSIDLHTEEAFDQNGKLSEDRMNQLLEMKICQLDQVKDSTCGQFLWTYNSHDNPGRVQNDEGLREIDRIGPFNYKGLLTSWGEPVDAFYLYRSNYAPKEKEPMVYIVSHTWPDRWAKSGVKSGLTVYSNCDEVELFNDVKTLSLGKRTKNEVGAHFQWDNVDLKYNVLYAVGYVNGKAVAEDVIVLNNLPRAPHFDQLVDKDNITKPEAGYNYIYRVNCGGADYTDVNRNKWLADRHLSGKDRWGSLSWTDDYGNLPSFLASQRYTKDPIAGSADWSLFQTFRYGRDRLRYRFPLPDGDYRVELYFVEPWYGTGGGTNCEGYRVFDVAANGKTLLRDLDIWKEAGHDRVLKKVVTARAENGVLEISFPGVKAGQAVISAIAVASTDKSIQPAPQSESIITKAKGAVTGTWLEPNADFPNLKPEMYGAEWLASDPKAKAAQISFTLTADANVYLRQDTGYVKTNYRKGETVTLKKDSRVAVVPVVKWMVEPNLRPELTFEAATAQLQGSDWQKITLKNKAGEKVTADGLHSITWSVAPGVANVYALRFNYLNLNQVPIDARIRITDQAGNVVRNDAIRFPVTPEKWRVLGTSTGSYINAGHYKVIISGDKLSGLAFESLVMQ